MFFVLGFSQVIFMGPAKVMSFVAVVMFKLYYGASSVATSATLMSGGFF